MWWGLVVGLVILTAGCTSADVPERDIATLSSLGGVGSESGWLVVEIDGPSDDTADAVVRTSTGSSPQAPRAIHAWTIRDSGALALIGQYGGWEPRFGQSSVSVGPGYVLSVPDFRDGHAVLVLGWYGLDRAVTIEILSPLVTWRIVDQGSDVWHGGPYVPPSHSAPVEVSVPSEGPSLVYLHVRSSVRNLDGNWTLQTSQGVAGRTFRLDGGWYVSSVADGPAWASLASTLSSATEMWAFSMPLPEGFVAPQIVIDGPPSN